MINSLEALERLFKDIEQCSIDLARADLDDYKIIEKALKEHEQYKAIEQELGIDLVTLLDKALKNGLWYYSKQKGHLFVAPSCLLLNVFHKFIYADLVDNCGRRTGRLIIKLSAYGKTWALTKEELL